ncbi:MAG: formate--tetrahydrofolate ligase [Parabacteroides merdae]
MVDTIEKKPSTPLKYIYEDNEPIRSKIKKVSEQIYLEQPLLSIRHWRTKKIKQIESLGISHYPICIAKTQYSFSSDPKAYGVAKNFELKVRDIIINNGAEMIVVIMGEIMRMPGLPKDPQAKRIDIVDDVIEGLS